MGVEPLGNALDGALLARLFAGKAAPLKAALLDQRLIAGLGNIYVCEVLHRAGLSPRRAAGTLSRRNGAPSDSAHRLAAVIPQVLHEAVAAGGSSLRDHRQTDGTWLFPAPFPRLRSRGGTVSDAGLFRHDPPHRAIRSLDVLL